MPNKLKGLRRCERLHGCASTAPLPHLLATRDYSRSRTRNHRRDATWRGDESATVRAMRDDDVTRRQRQSPSVTRVGCKRHHAGMTMSASDTTVVLYHTHRHHIYRMP